MSNVNPCGVIGCHEPPWQNTEVVSALGLVRVWVCRKHLDEAIDRTACDALERHGFGIQERGALMTAGRKHALVELRKCPRCKGLFDAVTKCTHALRHDAEADPVEFLIAEDAADLPPCPTRCSECGDGAHHMSEEYTETIVRCKHCHVGVTIEAWWESQEDSDDLSDEDSDYETDGTGEYTARRRKG